MFKRTLLASAIAVGAAIGANPLLAEPSSGTQMHDTAQIGKASEWIGREVKDQQDNSVGEITDFAVNLNDASIPFAVVELDGMFNSKSIAVPLSALRAVPGDDSTVTLAASGSQWKAAKTFDAASWPQTPTLMLGAAVSADRAVTSQTAGATQSAYPDNATRTTMSADLDREFDRLDSNADGYLSAKEIESDRTLSASEDTDRNQDGRIDKAEFSAFEAMRDDAHGSDH